LRDAFGRFKSRGRAGNELKVAPGGGKRRPQIRARHKRAITVKEIEHFLSILAETCNVSLAARETKRSARNFYDLKKRDPAFRAALWAEAEALPGGVDVLINNAAFGHYGPIEDEPFELIEAMFQANVLALVDLTQRAIRHMKARGRGQQEGGKQRR
jgi:NAD(P)-dependent dehydrogenase (short-subunit alcohol dehydrogenase family)